MRKVEQTALDELFERANMQWEAANLRSAFRLFLAGAKAEDAGARLNLGNFYSEGIGEPNRQLALYWYRLAYRRGLGAAVM